MTSRQSRRARKHTNRKLAAIARAVTRLERELAVIRFDAVRCGVDAL